MTTEREMLEYAAKACGIELINLGFAIGPHLRGTTKQWNPLTNSADCAAMCAKLKISTNWASASIYCWDNGSHNERFFIDNNNDREAAWRYAATMVAAKIGGMK